MQTVYIFLIDGFEEIEALTAVDVLRRAGRRVQMVSLTPDEIVVGSHKISVLCDVNFENCFFDDAELLLVPGGTPAIAEHQGLRKLLSKFAAEEKPIAAICAAPLVLGQLGLLRGRKATCYPGFEQYLEGAEVLSEQVVCDGNYITGRGPGASLEFALAVAARLVGEEKADELATTMCVKR